MPKLVTTVDFVNKAKAVHGDRYDYSESVYARAKEMVKIICPKHGVFWQSPNQHVRGRGCPRCGRDKIKGARDGTVESFLIRAREVHGARYSYGLVCSSAQWPVVTIVCQEHGPFHQDFRKHASGHGCPKCKGRRISESKSLNNQLFLKKAKAVHGEVYDYSKVKCHGVLEQVEIICGKHGSFWQAPCVHIGGSGCPKCGREVGADKHRLENGSVVARFRAVHGDRYDYSEVNHTESHVPVTISCRDHGSFRQFPYAHDRGQGCPVCARLKADSNTSSKGETEVCEWVNLLGIEVIQRDRTLIYPHEVDVLIPSLKLAIEYNGMYWHTTIIPARPEDKLYHLKKAQACRDRGYTLFTIWEEDWIGRNEVVKHWLAHKVGKSRRLCSARECEIVSVGHKEAADFYTHYHLQGSPGSSSISMGLRFNEDLVACMTFSRSMAERKRKAECGEFLLSRFAVAGPVPGAANRLFKSLVASTGSSSVITYSDNMYASGGVYSVLGFEKEAVLPPDYRVWHSHFGLRHKSYWQRTHIPYRLKELGLDDAFDPETDPRTEFEMCALAGCRHAWDAGKVKWVWRKSLQK